MNLKTMLLTGAAALTVGVLSTTTAQAKTLKYRSTSSNSFSYTTFHQAFMYGGKNDDYTELFKSAKTANNEDYDGYYTLFSDTDHNRTYYARKLKGYSHVMQLKYAGHIYYVNTKEAGLYRYNAWRSGHKIVSFVKPTSKHVLLKAHTHVYSTQPWLYNAGDKLTPYYEHFKVSKKGNWYEYWNY